MCGKSLKCDSFSIYAQFSTENKKREEQIFPQSLENKDIQNVEKNVDNVDNLWKKHYENV